MTFVGRVWLAGAALMVAAGLMVATASARTDLAYRVQQVAPVTSGTGEARAINAAGDVAGQYDGAAFIWHAGRFRRFPAVRYIYLGDSYTSVVTGINDTGTAVGVDGAYMQCVMTGLELTTAVTFGARGMHFIDRAGSCSFEADAINDRGTIVGENGYRGFVRYADGREFAVQPLSTRPEDNGTRATALDNKNHVVGGTTIDVSRVPQIQVSYGYRNGETPHPYYGPDPNAYVIHAFLLTLDGTQRRMRDLGALVGYPDTIATAISEDLIVVGYSGNQSGPKRTRVSGPSHAWVWQRGRMTDLGAARDADSYAYGVNDTGVIVGCSGHEAVRWVGEHMQDLNTLIDPSSGWHLTCARGINRAGMLVGTGEYHGGAAQPFELVPLHASHTARP